MVRVSGGFKRFSQKSYDFVFSDYYLLIVIAIGAIGFIFELERWAIGIMVLMLSFNLIAFREMLPNFGLILIIALTPLGRYAQDGYFYPLAIVAPFILIGLIIHLIIYPPKVPKLRYLYPLLAVSVAITIGGLFGQYFKESFKMPTLYYIIMLGFGMVVVYIFFESYIEKNNPKIVDYFAKIMVAVGIMGIIMMLTRYIQYGELFRDLTLANRRLINMRFQFRNNLTNNLLISMPFSFYLASKGKRPTLYFILGILQYCAMLFSLSRGGMIFGTMVIPFLILFTIILNKNKKDRIKMLSVLGIMGVAVIAVGFIYLNGAVEWSLDRLDISPNEARARLYAEAWENFKAYPLFGTGLGYNSRLNYNPEVWCIYWYHSTLFQILGSLGLAGVFAYGYYYIVRIIECIRYRAKFNVFLFLAFLGFEAYSLVNVGNFAPLPFVMMIVVMFIILDRSNELMASQPNRLLEEKIFKKDYLYINKAYQIDI